MLDLSTHLGPVWLSTPLVAASGTVGSTLEFEQVTDFTLYGAAIAKSVSRDPWDGRPHPRVAPVGTGMLNGIGIQNPGIEEWEREIAPRFGLIPTDVWGSVVGKDAEEFAEVAARMAEAQVPAVEVNLSCPNLDGHMFALDAALTRQVVSSVSSAIQIPFGAKLSPNSEDIVKIAAAAAEAGAAWVTLTNTVWGAAIDVKTRRPMLSGTIGGYSGPPLKPVSLRCVIEVHRAIPDLPILGCGGIRTGDDVVEYLLAGASAAAIGTAHFESPRVAHRILRQLRRRMTKLGVTGITELIGGMEPW